MQEGPFLQSTDDIPRRSNPDVLTARGRHHKVGVDAADDLKRSGPDPPHQLELEPIVGEVQHRKGRTGAELAQQRPVRLGAKILVCRHGSALSDETLIENHR